MSESKFFTGDDETIRHKVPGGWLYISRACTVEADGRYAEPVVGSTFVADDGIVGRRFYGKDIPPCTVLEVALCPNEHSEEFRALVRLDEVDLYGRLYYSVNVMHLLPIVDENGDAA